MNPGENVEMEMSGEWQADGEEGETHVARAGVGLSQTSRADEHPGWLHGPSTHLKAEVL